MEAVGEEAGFDPMETFIRRWQNTVAQYIATRPILDLCEASEKNWGVQVGMWWWKQAGIDLAVARETAEAAVETDTDGMEE